MGWRRRIHCRWCGAEGHNKRTCPDRLATLTRQAENGNGWAQSQLEAKNRKSTRRCGWCGETGHNKRTCPHPAQAKALAPLLEETIAKLVTKAAANIGRGSIVEGSWNKNCVVLGVSSTLHFGASSLSEATLEEHRHNTSWLIRVLRSLTDGAQILCVTPKGEKTGIRLPKVKANLRDRPLEIGSPTTVVKVASSVPVECKVTVGVSSGATAKAYKGWIAVTNLLLDEVTWSHG